MADLVAWFKEIFNIDGPSPLDAPSLDEPYYNLLPREAQHAQLSSLPEDENSLLVGARGLNDLPQDRAAYERAEIQQECLDAWRFNPLARRIVALTSEYVVGTGMVVRTRDKAADHFLRAFWQHRHNRMDVRLSEFSDELTRSGNLFVIVSTDPAGMSYVRVVPAVDILEIHSSPQDVEQELGFEARGAEPGEAQFYPAWNPAEVFQGANGLPRPVMLHYAVNRPAGAQWGESDLAPVLRWLSRYAYWLEDRVRLNRFRNAFLYVVKARFANESARAARQAQLMLHPPSPGSVLVTDESEEWSVISPRLEAMDASTDGLAVKKMIASGVGVPLHFLAEPESSTRTTAEASGGPAFRRFEQRQRFLIWVVSDLLRVVLQRRALFDPEVNADAAFEVHGADISARDNTDLAQAAAEVLSVVRVLKEDGLIDESEMKRIIYRFLGENLEIDPQ